MAPPIRKTNFVPHWIDMGPKIPVPRIDWIADKKLDIAYGNDVKQRYDLYYPEKKTGKLPVVVIVHGGGFTHMDKRDWHMYPGFYAMREGFALISMNYRLAPAHRYPAGLNDVDDGLYHIVEHADEYGIDASNLFLYGTSAGGNLVSIIGLKSGAGKLRYRVRAVADLCGLIDFKSAYEEALETHKLLSRLLVHTVVRQYFGKSVRDSADLMKETSALTYVTKDAPPFYIQQGTKDPAISMRQATLLYDALKAAGLKEEDLVLDVLEGAGHAGGGPDYLEDRNILPILRFFEAHINK